MEVDSRRIVIRDISVLLAVSLVVFFTGIGSADIFFVDEARNAGCAKEMYENDEWLVPTFNCELRVEKPPLHYYFMKLGYAFFGKNAFGARFFSAFSGLICALLVYWAMATHSGLRTGQFAAGTLLATLHFPIQMKQAVPDPFLILFLYAGIVAIFSGRRKKQRAAIYLGYALLGLATLSKGPVAIAIAGLTFLIYLTISGKLNWQEIRAHRAVSGGLLTLAIATPWYVLVDRATSGNYTEGFFLVHNFSRFASPMEGHGGLFLLTWGFVLIGLIPATVFLFQSLAGSWKIRKRDPIVALALSGFAAVVLLFSLSSTRLPNYTAPAYPFAAMMIGHWLAVRVGANRNKRWLVWPSAISVLLAIAVAAGAYFGLKEYPLTSDIAAKSLILVPVFVFAVAGLLAAFRGQSVRSLLAMALFPIWSVAAFSAVVFPAIDSKSALHKAATDQMDLNNLAGYELVHPSWNFYYGCMDMYREEDVDDLLMKLRSGEYDGVMSRERLYEELNRDGDIVMEWVYQDLFETSKSAIFRLRDE